MFLVGAKAEAILLLLTLALLAGNFNLCVLCVLCVCRLRAERKSINSKKQGADQAKAVSLFFSLSSFSFILLIVFNFFFFFFLFLCLLALAAGGRLSGEHRDRLKERKKAQFKSEFRFRFQRIDRLIVVVGDADVVGLCWFNLKGKISDCCPPVHCVNASEQHTQKEKERKRKRWILIRIRLCARGKKTSFGG